MECHGSLARLMTQPANQKVGGGGRRTRRSPCSQQDLGHALHHYTHGVIFRSAIGIDEILRFRMTRQRMSRRASKDWKIELGLTAGKLFCATIRYKYAQDFDSVLLWSALRFRGLSAMRILTAGNLSVQHQILFRQKYQRFR